MIENEYKTMIHPKELARIMKISESEARKKEMKSSKYFPSQDARELYKLGIVEALIAANAEYRSKVAR